MALSGFNHNINWNEFQIIDQAPPGVTVDGQLFVKQTSLNWRTAMLQGGGCQVVSVNASIAADQNKSWVLKGKKGVYLRHHLQGQYDVIALGMREMYNRIENIVTPRCEDVNQEVARIQKEVQQQVDKAISRYDAQTKHGFDLSLQRMWETQIKTIKARVDGVVADLP